MKLTVAAALLCSAAFVGNALASQMSCNSLTTSGLFPDTKVRSTTLFAADDKQHLPAYCEVSAVIMPEPGSTIGVVYRLPESWNGKLFGNGGGGWIGNISIGGFNNIADALQRGYATAQTDGGHPIGTAFDSSWTADANGKPDLPKIKDFGNRAIHLMTVIGKEVVAKYYGHPQSHAYYQGCSTGGRQGLMEVQRYPDDYDGVIAGAPVYDLKVQITAVVRDNIFGTPQSRLSPEQFAMVNKASLAACDANDGVTDGVVEDPAKCKFDPGVLECKADALTAEGCLTTAQVDSLRTAYAGVKSSDGHFAGYPLAVGSETGWAQFGTPTTENPIDPSQGGGMGGLRTAIFGDASYDLSKFNVDSDTARVMSSVVAQEYNANNPDVSGFVGRGGKLLMWHGINDPGPSAIATSEYYERVAQTIDSKLFASNVRYFRAPGVSHCGGGAGPDRLDPLTALETWVENGKAPETLLATKANSPKSWALCTYPKLPHYKGKGDADDPKNYACK